MTDSDSPKNTPSIARMRPGRRRRLLVAGCGLALVAAAGFGIHWWVKGRFLVETDNAYVRADVVTIAPRVAGVIAALAVADNQRVRAGDILARIDDRDYRMKVAEAEGALSAAQAAVVAQQARIANFDARKMRQRSLIAQDMAALAARDAEARLATLDYRRQSSLSRQEVTSAQMFETAQADSRKANANLAEARARASASRDMLSVLTTGRDEAVADLDKARAAVRQAQAALDAAQLDLERTVIRAPVSGQVGQRTARVGHYAETGAPLMAVVPATAYIVANYKETQTERVRPGQSVTIAVDAFGGATLKGHVDSFAPASGAQFALLPPDNATGNFTKIVQRMPLRIRIDPGQARAAMVRPGMSVETIVDTRGDRR
ncbi:HlyD family secretion protein [Sphingobium cloacae]|uniref:Transporter n=1 Tax=Sphingobium cloacae TaxID=120107 RepID=A0A1E1F1G2_9SPHN|nr:HlyD family secretion protein [Sphingobium cloacae]BAV64368.1 transporter [Sphingobium cloacae]